MAIPVVEQFGRRRLEPHTGEPPPRQSIIPAEEEAASALAFVSRLNDEARRLQSENARLRQELALAHMRVSDLSKQVTDQRFYLEAYRRYSVAVQTHLQTVVDAATRANQAALDVSEPGAMPAELAEQVIADTEAQLRAEATAGLSVESIAKKYGANNREPNDGHRVHDD